MKLWGLPEGVYSDWGRGSLCPCLIHTDFASVHFGLNLVESSSHFSTGRCAPVIPIFKSLKKKTKNNNTDLQSLKSKKNSRENQEGVGMGWGI